jgi:uncharacterized protein YjbJ (UPF0337 family)
MAMKNGRFQNGSRRTGVASPEKLRTKGAKNMNSDQFAGQWKQAKGAVKKQWGKLTDNDLTVIEGNRDQLIGRIQERYGIAREEAQKQVDEWMRTHAA